MNRFYGSLCTALLGICFFAVGEIASADRPSAGAPDIVFSVSDDRTLDPPPTSRALPDEHTSVLPAGPPRLLNFFVAMENLVSIEQKVRPVRYGGTFVLQSGDLTHFAFAPGFGDANEGRAVFWPAHAGVGNCDYPTVTHFDEQYAGAASVVQDPTLPPGNLIMIYEAEIHCPAPPNGVAAGYGSIGATRSSDGGRTWPKPIAQPGQDWLEYGDGRYAAITVPGTPPKNKLDRGYGDDLPSAFVDDMDPSGNYYIYVAHQFSGDPTGKEQWDGRIRVARAWLGDRYGHHQQGQLHFHKWYRGGWYEEGRGGLEEGALASCGPSTYQAGAQIAYIDPLRRYVMTFVCNVQSCPAGKKCHPQSLSLFYSTATSLSAQDWTIPQLIQHSTYAVQPDPEGGWIGDGAYPSFVSPECKPGHLGHSGEVFLLKGNSTGPDRKFVARTFEIKSGRRAAGRAMPGGARGSRRQPARSHERGGRAVAVRGPEQGQPL